MITNQQKKSHYAHWKPMCFVDNHVVPINVRCNLSIYTAKAFIKEAWKKKRLNFLIGAQIRYWWKRTKNKTKKSLITYNKIYLDKYIQDYVPREEPLKSCVNIVYEPSNLLTNGSTYSQSRIWIDKVFEIP